MDGKRISEDLRKKIDNITESECNEWIKRNINEDGDMYNPITKEYIDSRSKINNKIAKVCSKFEIKKPEIFYNMKGVKISHLEKWKNNPYKNPLNGEDIFKVFHKNSDYYKFYFKFFKLFRKKFKEDNQYTDEYILKKLPKEHLLFNGKLDLLYIAFKKNNKEDIQNGNGKEYDGSYILLNNKYEKILNKIIDYTVNINTADLYNESIVIQFFKEETYKKMSIIDKIYIEGFLYRYGINNVNENTINILKEHKKELDNYFYISKELNIIDNINSYIKREGLPISKFEVSDYFTQFNILVKTIFEFLLYKRTDYTPEYLKNIEDNYLNGEKLEEIIDNPENIVFKIIKDPLEEIFDSQELKDLDLNTLELPEQNITDNEFKKLNDSLKRKKSSYENKMQSFKDGKIDNPPPRPSVSYKTKTIIVGFNERELRQNYTDKEYAKMQEEYEKKRPLIEQYKKLINTNFLDLTGLKKKSPSKIPSRLNKSREEIKIEDLNENLEYDQYESYTIDEKNDKTKTMCLGNVAINSSDNNDNLDSDNYPLAKLQLLVKMHKRYSNGKIEKTYCFYAPDLYNILISQANNKEIFFNPTSPEHKFDKEDINELMKVMHMIDDSLEIPRFIKPMNDKGLTLNVTEQNYDNTNFYIFTIDRKIGDINYNIFYLCSVLGDVEPEEFKQDGHTSRDISSGVFVINLFKLFNSGKLLNNYVPPYYDYNTKQIIRLMIHFNNFRKPEQWLYNESDSKKSRQEQLVMFKRYLDEISTYV